MNKTKSPIQLFGLKLDSINKAQALEKIFEMVEKKTSCLVCTVNVEFVMRAIQNEGFNDILTKKSKLNLIDGNGVIWGHRLLTSWSPANKMLRSIYLPLQFALNIIFYPIICLYLSKKYYKQSGSDMAWEIAKKSVEANKSIFLLANKNGLDPNTVQKASLELQTKIYDLKIAGTLATTASDEDKKLAIEEIKRSGADIIFCTFGSPAQEFWLSENLGKTGAKVGLGLGATLDFIAGTQKRAPRFISAIGLEWLYRLIRQPSRINRQKNLFKFVKLIYKTKLEG